VPTDVHRGSAIRPMRSVRPNGFDGAMLAFHDERGWRPAGTAL
jgi:hypothetical protein